MDNDYIQKLKDEKTQTDIRVINTLYRIGIIPNSSNPTKNISLLKEVIIKVIYLHKVFFLEELIELFSSCYCRQQIEETMLYLEKQGYVISKIDKEYGKCFCLTKESIFFIKFNPEFIKTNIRNVNINDDKLPQDLIKYKCISKMTSSYIFNKQVSLILESFKNQPKEDRQVYSAFEYIKHIYFKEFLLQDKNVKISLLKELNFTKDEIQKIANLQKYNEKIANVFSKQYLEVLGIDCLEDSIVYLKYKELVKRYCLKKSTRSNRATYMFLKDFSGFINKKEALIKILDGVLRKHNTYMRLSEKVINNYFVNNNESKIYKIQNELFFQEEILRIEKTDYRKLINSKTEISTEELKQVTENIVSLKTDIDNTSKYIKTLYDNFQYLIFDKIKSNGLVMFNENIITLSRLQERGIYITDIKKGEYRNIIEFTIVQNRTQGFAFGNLFSKLEWVYLIYSNVFKEYDIQINIATLGEDRKQVINQTLGNIKNLFAEIPEYRILHSIFDDTVNVIDCKEKNLERYEVFNFIKAEMNK